MARDLNQCNFIGRLGKDPEARYTAGGDAVATFSIAVGESWTDKNGDKQEKTEWIRVVAFKKLAEIIAEYVVKGSKVFISGKFTTRKWTNKDGVDQYTTEIVAEQMQMLDSKPRDGEEQSARPSRQQETRREPAKRGNDDFDDDIPF